MEAKADITDIMCRLHLALTPDHRLVEDTRSYRTSVDDLHLFIGDVRGGQLQGDSNGNGGPSFGLLFRKVRRGQHQQVSQQAVPAHLQIWARTLPSYQPS